MRLFTAISLRPLPNAWQEKLRILSRDPRNSDTVFGPREVDPKLVLSWRGSTTVAKLLLLISSFWFRGRPAHTASSF